MIERVVLGNSRIQNVLSHDLCIACGACVYACPEHTIEPVYNPVRRAHEVEITAPEYCSHCESQCERVCPSIAVDILGLIGKQDYRQASESVLGPIHSIHIGYSPEQRFNGLSSSGGVIRSLLHHALRLGQPVVCLARVSSGYEPRLLHTLDQLSNVPGSIYHSVSFTKCIALLRSVREPCILVCTPCQLEGISKFIQIFEPELRHKILLKVGIICGWMFSDHAINAFTHFKGISHTVVDVQYRGEDKVGMLKIQTEHGIYKFDRRKFDGLKERIDYACSFSPAMNRLRCRLCRNHLNVIADLAVGDAWLQRKSSDKTSIIIARTQEGSNALHELCGTGEIVLEDASKADILESQGADLALGLASERMAAFLVPKGVAVPRFNYGEARKLPRLPLNLRLFFCHEMLSRVLVSHRLYGLYRSFYILKYTIRNIAHDFRCILTRLRRKA